MARVACLLAVLICLSMVVPTPATSPRKLSKGMVSFAIRAWCIPTTESLLEEHEGRHSCVYKLHNGDKAVGVGYNLDDDVETRRSEIATVLADYDKVRDGKSCLNNVQISALLALDARRALDRAANDVKSLDDQCCPIMSVFGDIQHSSGGKNAFEGNGFEDFIEAVSAKNWHKAGKELESTKWCKDNRERCRSDRTIIQEGCSNSNVLSMITAFNV